MDWFHLTPPHPIPSRARYLFFDRHYDPRPFASGLVTKSDPFLLFQNSGQSLGPGLQPFKSLSHVMHYLMTNGLVGQSCFSDMISFLRHMTHGTRVLLASACGLTLQKRCKLRRPL